MLHHGLLVLQLAATAAAPDPDPNVYHARAGRTEVAAPRIEGEAVTVDGALEEAVWARAARLTGFSQYRPVDGEPAADSTEVLVWYAPDALHVGIRAWEPHGVVNATLADRDHIFNDDNVQLLLDTFDDRRRALVFAVNPLGVQADGVRSEGEQSGTWYSAEAAEGGRTDLSPDFVFQSRGRVTDWGYEVELRIPFESLRFQPDDPQRWGINVVREVQHAGQTLTWTPVRRGQTSFLAQSGGLAGLTGLERGLVLDVNTVATRRLIGADPHGTGWNYTDEATELGLNTRWGITPNLTASGTINPDFSQVEADVAQIQFDPRQAVAFPEKRPFFLEGSENFSVPNNLIFTRTIVAPEAAVKLSGKVAGTDVGVLSALDDEAVSASGRDNPIVNLLRVRRDLGEESTLGLAYTDRIDGEDWNRVASVDGRFVFGSHTVRLQGAGAFTRVGGTTISGPLWDARVERSGRAWGWSATLRGIDDEFVAGSGFISRTGIVYQSIAPRLSFYGEPGDRVETFSTSINFNNMWLYDRFTGGELRPDELKVHFNNSLAFRGGWTASVSLLLENFLYPDYLYGDYFVERRDASGAVTDTAAFTGTPSINNYDLVFAFGTPQFPTLSANGFLLFGRDENFPEWAPGWLVWAEGELDWRPTEQLRISPRYNETRVMRPDDWSVVQVTQIPRLKVEYQVSRPIFVRVVGQYVAFRQDALHDDSRTEDPILIRQPDGSLTPALATRSNRLRFDALFSYQPTPGTVIFAGYGSSMGEERAFRFRRLERTQDGFFVKLSYLFRV